MLSACSLLAACVSAQAQDAQDKTRRNRIRRFRRIADEDPQLPNGKSQKDAIAKQQHEQALKDADELVDTAQATAETNCRKPAITLFRSRRSRKRKKSKSWRERFAAA